MNAITKKSEFPAGGGGSDGIIKVAMLAVGGQGGGVLTSWIEAVARANGYLAQATSVAGVAQRTGATVYYVEMAPKGLGQQPVLSLMPSAGDVDIMITTEMMEAGRSIMRGFVTPDRTVLITSSHRSLAVSEKMAPGDGIASSEEVLAAAQVAARRLICADFDALAIANGSVISATMFGALAGSGALPFPREAFEEAIRTSGKGVEPSLRAFAAGFDAAQQHDALAGPALAEPAAQALPPVRGPEGLVRQWDTLAAQTGLLPAAAAEMALAGLRKVVDFQDIAYGREYLGHLETIAALDTGAGDLTREAAKYIANAMAYDDIIRVADAKTRAGRSDRIAREMRLKDGQLMQVTEFMHPRAEELVSLLPAKMGARWQANPDRMKLVDRLFNRGRRIRTDGFIGFFMLYVMGGAKNWRRRSLRHAEEMAHLHAWLDRVRAAPSEDVAIELLRNQRLIKGYSCTHARGQSKFARVMEGAQLVEGRADAADWIRRLREAALKDEEGKGLDGALQTIRSFA